VFTRPDDVTDADVVAVLREGWAIAARAIGYAAVGFGSHHWRVVDADGRPWFVTVDDLDTKLKSATDRRHDACHRLDAALSIARSLHDRGLAFVVAPVVSRVGAVVHPINDRYVAALYRHVDGTTHDWGPFPHDAARTAVLDRIIEVHRAPVAFAPDALVDDFTIPSRDELAAALVDTSRSWRTGPFGERARQLLLANRAAVADVLAHYDSLVVIVAGHRERMVLTHGEPHRGNTIDTSDGVVLIDWDTALIAPRERDLWAMIDEDPAIAQRYTEQTGVVLDDQATRLYRLWWDLCEIAIYVTQFRAEHRDNEDTRVAWRSLQSYLRADRWNDIC
jgi:hypothetical protein